MPVFLPDRDNGQGAADLMAGEVSSAARQLGLPRAEKAARFHLR
jgi:hypothetical protein